MPKATKTTTKSTETTNKTTTRTSGVTRSQAVKYLSKVPEDRVFWCNNGAILNDVRELKDALANMSDETFYYHSNEIKKDFSNWMRDVVGDNKLAGDLEKASNREQAVKMVEERCNLLVSKAD
jgi:hypothetical protein